MDDTIDDECYACHGTGRGNTITSHCVVCRGTGVLHPDDANDEWQEYEED